MYTAAAQMCVVIIQHMPHLAVGDGGFHKSELHLSPDNRGAPVRTDGPENARQRIESGVFAPSQSATEPVKNTAPTFMDNVIGQILELQIREIARQFFRNAEIKVGRALFTHVTVPGFIG